MPAHGDQYRATAASANPFEDHTPRVGEFTAIEIARLQSRLDRQLGPEYISTRPGAGGGKVHYLAAEKVINLANEVFGFNGWSSQIQNVQIDFVDENQTNGKITLGLSTIVRVTLRDGTFHEDIGYGHIENCKGKAAAFEKAKKEATTDALKRALRNFGNVLGNCLYDKDYLQKITKIKVLPSKWDAENLHRHPDYAPVKKEGQSTTETGKAMDLDKKPAQPLALDEPVSIAEHEDEFGWDVFDETELNEGHPDEVVLHAPGVTETSNESSTNAQSKPNQTSSNHPHTPQNTRRPYQPQNARQNVPQTSHQAGSAQSSLSKSNETMAPPTHIPNPSSRLPNANTNSATDNGANANNSKTNTSTHHTRPQNTPPQRQTSNPQPHQDPSRPTHQPQNAPPRSHEPPVGFITTRAALLLKSDDPISENVAATLPKFNPNAESRTIRRTSGVNHSTSAPISRAAAVTNGASSSQSSQSAVGATPTTSTTSFINPSTDFTRRVGMPPSGMAGGAASPLANRGSYKPPGPAVGAKRPLVPSHGDATARAPLSDVSNTTEPPGGNASLQQQVGKPVVAAGDDGKRLRVGET